MRSEPITLRLTAPALARGDGLTRLLAQKLSRSSDRRRAPGLRLVSAFAFVNDERRFARALLERHPRFWLFRTNQRRFCGDFVLVDMSSPDVERRAPIALDLKRGARLRLGGGGAGNAFVRLTSAIGEIVRETGALARGVVPQRITGDGQAILTYVSSPASPPASH